MTTENQLLESAPEQKIMQKAVQTLSSKVIDDARKACQRIAPVWPLKHFVAVNPYMGLSEFHFLQATEVLRHVHGANSVVDKDTIAEGIRNGEILDSDIQKAIESMPALRGIEITVDDLIQSFAQDGNESKRWLNVTDIATRFSDKDWSRFSMNQISKWCSAYFDEGQAFWSMPDKEQGIFEAWIKFARQDRTADIIGLKGFRRCLSGISTDPEICIEEAISNLCIPESCREAYFFQCLASISGWAAMARYHGWSNELDGEQDDTLLGLLAIRIAIDAACFLSQSYQDGFIEQWSDAITDYHTHGVARISSKVYEDCILQTAYDFSSQRRLISRFNHSLRSPESIRKQAQAVFCIDVRSEVYRRALETVNGAIETYGFAGFFGFPIEYVPLGEKHGGSQCPVLLKPGYVIKESLRDADEEEHDEVIGLRILRRRALKAWKYFKQSAVSSFSFVETMGFSYVVKLVTDGFALTRTVPHPKIQGLDSDIISRRQPEVQSGMIGDRHSGIELEERITLAENALKAMSLQAPYAPFVLLVGHGSTTVNNPHASGLDCGACGGHTGEANARVAAAVLNNAQVRVGLAERGIEIPSDTLFLGCLHDTTTDELTIFDADELPPSMSSHLASLKKDLLEAGKLTRQERALRMGIHKDNIDKAISLKSSDWSQVRPELGLAGCSSFIVAPRYRTAGLNLGGESFLHSYHWQDDQDFKILELIMTAPMVVTSWINLQYYGSTVDNEIFGSGNKTLHNVVGQVGVLEGNTGDLRVGLPKQSIHDGENFIHKPLRLAVMIEAPKHAINNIIAQHENIRQLLDNDWIYLYAINEDGLVSDRYISGMRWEEVSVSDASELSSVA